MKSWTDALDILKAVKTGSCPVATQDLEMNTRNRDKAIKAAYIQYGPLNVTRPGLVEPGQKVDPLNQIKFLMTGKKEAEAIKNNYIFIVL